MKTLLKHCRIYEGTGADAFTGDILIEGDRILEVAPNIDAQGAQIADLTVFDETTLRNAVPDQPKAFGIERVYVNGKPVLSGETLDKDAFASSGRAMRAR